MQSDDSSLPVSESESTIIASKDYKAVSMSDAECRKVDRGAEKADIASKDYKAVSMSDAECRKVDRGAEKAEGEGGIKPAAVVESASFSDLFSLSDASDAAFTRIALSMAILSGLNQPAQLIIFGSILNSFGATTDTDPGAERDRQIRQVNFLSIMYLVVGIQQFLTNFLQTACIQAAASRQIKRLRVAFLEALVRLPVSFYDANDQGALASSVMTDTMVVEDGLGEKPVLAFQFIVAFAAGLAVALYYCWKLALLILGGIPLVFAVIGVVIGVLISSQAQESAASNAASSLATEVFSAVRTILALGVETKEESRYSSLIDQTEVAGIKKWQAQGITVGSINGLMWLLYAAGLYFGAWLISEDMMRDPQNCTYKVDAFGKLVVPDSSKCITGGNVMITFFSVIFGGLNLGQAVPGLSALASARTALFKILKTIRSTSSIDPLSQEGASIENVQGEI